MISPAQQNTTNPQQVELDRLFNTFIETQGLMLPINTALGVNG